VRRQVLSAAILEEATRLETEVEREGECIRNLNETIREEDRILAMLEEQNSRVSPYFSQSHLIAM
jgi:predicted RNase H-like nuclease (RuvC/YqgF family)